MEQNIPDELKDSKYNKPPYNGWEVNPKYDVPHLGPYVYVDNDGNIKMPKPHSSYYMEAKENNE
jgi:hypothetical protein